MHAVAVTSAEAGVRPREVWANLLLRAAVTVTSLHAVAALVLWDLDAALLMLLGAASVTLVMWRRTRAPGRIVAFLVLLDTAVWTVFGVGAHLRTGASGPLAGLNALLATTSLLGVMAGVVAIAERRRPTSSERPARLAAGVSGVIAVALTVAVVEAGDVEREPTAGDVVVDAVSTSFAPSELAVPPGVVRLHMTNHDFFWHTFTIDELAVRLALPVGGADRVEFAAEPGSYRFFCEIPGHEGAGMHGILTVTN